MTSIEWTDEVWNPVTGCSRVSEGCRHCYIERTPPFRMSGRTFVNGTTGVQLHPERLEAPLHWRKPRRVFVNSLSDLFHEDVPDEFIEKVMTVISLTQQHTYQILTKRPERMRVFFRQEEGGLLDRIKSHAGMFMDWDKMPDGVWPMEHLWIGVSVEDQQTADERIPILLQIPAAVRFVSAEPLLGPVDIAPWIRATTKHHFRVDVEGMLRNRSFAGLQHNDGRSMSRQEAENELFALHAKGVKYIPASSCDVFDPEDGCKGHPEPRLDWVIVGGESGPGARPCHVGWIRSIKQQCRNVKVPCFIKQLGSNPKEDGCEPGYVWVGKNPTSLQRIKHKKGGDPQEWAADLRLREWPR